MEIDKSNYSCWEECFIKLYKADKSVINNSRTLNQIYVLWKTDNTKTNTQVKEKMKSWVNSLILYPL